MVGDKLYFYYNAHSGYNNDHVPYMYAGGSTHLAMLRRNGFASMDAADRAESPGELVTRLLRFSGKHLFVNLDAPQGNLTAEVLDDKGNIIEPFSAAQCVPASGDGTRMRVSWKSAAAAGDLGALAGRVVQFRFRAGSTPSG